MILAFAGGVGGAKLAHGLSMCLPPEELVVAVNTGDDFEHLGLHISPDLDTVMYTLAGVADRERGWGLSGETWNFMQALKRLGGDTWFNLGDKDLATHIERTRQLKSGATLSAVTQDLTQRLGVRHAIVPMSDDSVRTRLDTDEGELEFQDYFVRRACRPCVSSVEYRGAEEAAPSGSLMRVMESPNLRGIVICPSNPVLSIGPILALAGLRNWLGHRGAPAVAVSPIIAGAAVKGPAAKILRELGREADCTAIAEFYHGLIDGLVVHVHDAPTAQTPPAMRLFSTNILMHDEADRKRLASETVSFLEQMTTRQ